MKIIEKPDATDYQRASDHQRLSEYKHLVYPVFSRRAGGLSLGINVNPDKKCNFNCVYCQVDKSLINSDLSANAPQIVKELEDWLKRLEDEGPDSDWRLKDISVAGDGEPTLVKFLPELIRQIIKIKSEFGLEDRKIIIFSNGSRIDRKDLEEIWPDFFDANGEIWLKLDFWDEQSLKKINQTNISAEKLLNNLTNLGKQYPLVLQTSFFSYNSETLRTDRYQSYIELILRLLKQGVKIKLIQAYTLARRPSDQLATPWSDREMDEIVRFLKDNLPVTIETFYQN